MVEVIHRHKVVFFTLCIVIIAALVWLVFSRQNLNRIPSRGVFVMNHAGGANAKA